MPLPPEVRLPLQQPFNSPKYIAAADGLIIAKCWDHSVAQHLIRCSNRHEETLAFLRWLSGMTTNNWQAPSIYQTAINRAGDLVRSIEKEAAS